MKLDKTCLTNLVSPDMNNYVFYLKDDNGEKTGDIQSFTFRMREYCGKEAKIVKYSPVLRQYSIDIDGEKYCWPKEFFHVKNELVISKNNWREQGLCPVCGEKGPFIGFQMTCPKHGVY